MLLAFLPPFLTGGKKKEPVWGSGLTVPSGPVREPRGHRFSPDNSQGISQQLFELLSLQPEAKKSGVN